MLFSLWLLGFGTDVSVELWAVLPIYELFGAV